MLLILTWDLPFFFNDVSPRDSEIHVPIEVKEKEDSAKKQENLEKKQKEGLWTM